eukprot:1181497-Prorocentrum_minimum.AAC.1
MTGASIYQEREPIAGRERVYTGSGSQSQAGREYRAYLVRKRRQDGRKSGHAGIPCSDLNLWIWDPSVEAIVRAAFFQSGKEQGVFACRKGSAPTDCVSIDITMGVQDPIKLFRQQYLDEDLDDELANTVMYIGEQQLSS